MIFIITFGGKMENIGWVGHVSVYPICNFFAKTTINL